MSSWTCQLEPTESCLHVPLYHWLWSHRIFVLKLKKHNNILNRDPTSTPKTPRPSPPNTHGQQKDGVEAEILTSLWPQPQTSRKHLILLVFMLSLSTQGQVENHPGKMYTLPLKDHYHLPQQASWSALIRGEDTRGMISTCFGVIK